MKILEKYKEKNKFNNIKLLVQNYKNDLQRLLSREKLQEFEIEYLIQNFELNKECWSNISWAQKLSEGFIEKYNVESFPTIIIQTGDDTVKYDGKVEQEEFTKFIEQNIQ